MKGGDYTLIAIYSRKSKYTGKGESIANQIELCRQYIELHFCGEEYTVYEDEGFSGKNTQRPRFKEMMLEVDRGSISKIVCYRLDRISRNMSDFVRLIDLLNEKGVQFISVNEQFDTTVPMGKAMMYISSIFSQLERETIAERIRDNLMELAKTGRWLGGITPMGYRSVEVESIGIKGRRKTAHRLEIVESEGEIIRLIYDKFIELGSLSALEAYLINRDIKTRNNIYFSRHAIKSILKNPVYSVADEDSYSYFKEYDIFADKTEFDGNHGVIAYNKTKQSKKRTKINPVEDWVIAVGGHRGIIRGCDWVKVQNILRGNSDKAFRKPRVNEALLGGLVYCVCGSRMGPKMGRGTYFYACKMKLKSNRGKCQAENLYGKKLDDKIVELIKGLECSKSSLVRELEKRRKYIKAENDRDTLLLYKKISNNKGEIKSLVSRLSAAKNSAAEKYILDRINELDSENKAVEREIAEIEKTENQNKANEKMLEDFRNRVISFSSCVDSMTLDEKRSAIKQLINKILWTGSNIEVYFTAGNKVSIEWNNMLIDNMGKETWERLKYWRCRRRYLQREVADGAGITRAMYMSYEKENSFCPAENLFKIAEFLKIDFNDLADDYHRFQLDNNQCERIKKARENLGLSKTDFAKLVGVDRSTVYKWEKTEGKMSRRDYWKIRRVTEI